MCPLEIKLNLSNRMLIQIIIIIVEQILKGNVVKEAFWHWILGNCYV